MEDIIPSIKFPDLSFALCVPRLKISLGAEVHRYSHASTCCLLRVSKIQGMDLEITTAAALRGHSRGHSSPEKITALPSNRTVNTSIELINTSIELINTSIETHAALAFSFMHALNIMFTSPQAITQSLAIML